MKKKILAFTLSLCLIFAMFSTVAFNVSAATTGTYNGFKYKINDSECTITGYSGSGGNIEIPSEIEGYPVTSIGDWAFDNCNFTSVIIPNGVTSIGDSAFFNCTSLISVTIPNSVTSICGGAFSYCSSLTSLTIPDSVTNIGNYAFPYCASLVSVKIGSGVTSISEGTFYDCDSLTSLEIPSSVTSIGDYAVAYCDLLASITIPSSVTNIGDKVFYNCTSLTSVTIPNSVTKIGSSVFYGCDSIIAISVDSNNKNYSSDEYGVLYNKDKTKLIQYPIGDSRTSFTIPSSVTNIGAYAFSNCNYLTSTTIPNSVTSIGDYAFYGCDFLASVKIGSGVTSIGESAFRSCNFLAAISVDNNNKNYSSDEYGVLYNKGKLIQYPMGNSRTSFTIPSSVTNINKRAFYSCSFLTSIIIPNSVTNIGNSAFENCDSLTSITIPNSVESIGSYALSTCVSLTSVKIGSGLTSISDSLFFGCTSLTSVTIPNSVTSISGSAFAACDSFADVYFLGTEDEWNKIDIGWNNNPLTGANIHYMQIFEMTEGDESVWEETSETPLTFRSTAEFADFERVEVDGITVDAENYDVSTGSTIVKLKNSYLKTLAPGKHDISIISKTGVANGEFEVKNSISEFTPGDIDGNTNVNLNDVTLLAQYVAKWNVDVNIPALDTDGNGSVNLNDVTRLAQKVAKWNVEISEKAYVPK